MRIVIDREKELPLYRQIEDYIRALILSGKLEAGTRLPAIRRLAQDLGVNRITIETAYDGLKAEGLVDSKVGSGTYVLPLHLVPLPANSPPSIPNAGIFHSPASEKKVSSSQHNDVIDFGIGVGDSSLFPVEEFRKLYNRVMRRDGTAALEYGPAEGFPLLKEMVAHILASQGLNCSPEEILITSGSQQAILLAVLLLLKPGDTILVEAPTYSGALDMFYALGFNVVGIPSDTQGVRLDLVEYAVEKYSPKLIYTVPTFNNPTGVCLSGARRRQLVGLAAHHQMYVLEDDFVGDLRYEGRTQPPLRAFEGGRDWVIYASTFSKMLMPGLRVGFMVVSEKLYQALVDTKQAIDLATSNPNQRGLAEFINIGRYRKFLRRSVALYRHRRDVMMEAVADHLPQEVEVVYRPEGGLFLWVALPPGQSAQSLQQRALEVGVSIGTGENYYPKKIIGSSVDIDRYFRLNFAAFPEGKIVRGIKRLGQVI